jgi:hypothetical protein
MKMLTTIAMISSLSLSLTACGGVSPDASADNQAQTQVLDQSAPCYLDNPVPLDTEKLKNGVIFNNVVLDHIPLDPFYKNAGRTIPSSEIRVKLFWINFNDVQYEALGGKVWTNGQASMLGFADYIHDNYYEIPNYTDTRDGVTEYYSHYSWGLWDVRPKNEILAQVKEGKIISLKITYPVYTKTIAADGTEDKEFTESNDTLCVKWMVFDQSINR